MKKIIITLLAVLPLALSAEVYKWTDENGNVHFGDKPKNTASAEAVQIREQKTGALVTPQQKKLLAANTPKPKTDLEKAQEKYDEVRAGFYETTNPDPYCKEAVDRQDRYSGKYMYKKRKTYLCPKPEK